MSENLPEDRLKVIRDYSAGLVGTRDAMHRAGLDDFAELIIALAQNDLDLPRPADTAERRKQVERAAAILQPLLRHGH